ncbi:hypothetical protein IKF21_02175 [Candidatus Saccharibacteria bacterium]|nr:hypothetical protein [Candidatus Saccharibacteria bacterium]
MVERARKSHIWGWICLLVIIGVGVGVFLNREWLFDYYRGITYHPSSEMARIRSDLQLTDKGEFLFNAAQPELEGSAEFNSYCRNDGSEVAVLGCYTSGNIYVYNIENAELNGIRELTTAHELLHAKWARMSEDERRALVEPLTRTFEANQSLLESELNTYETSEKQEELYVRAGTEIAKLPDILEKHYAEIFKNQDAIVTFYNNYIGVFKTLTAELDTLKAEMDEIGTQIDAKKTEYENRVDQLTKEVNDFNNCAKTEGCFETEWLFNARRAELVTEQGALELLYNEINDLVNIYNTKVEAYNADVLRSEKLNNMINSASKPKEIE